MHQPVGSEFPILVSIGSEPVAFIVVPLVREAHGDTVLIERPQLFDESILVLAVPGDERGRDELVACLDARPRQWILALHNPFTELT